MKAIRTKLHSSSGVTILYALMLLLVAGTVSAVLLASASSAMKSVYTDLAAEQDYLTVSSAARKLGALAESERAADTKTPEGADYTLLHYEKTSSWDVYEEQFEDGDTEQENGVWVYVKSESGTTEIKELSATGEDGTTFAVAPILAAWAQAIREPDNIKDTEIKEQGSKTIEITVKGPDSETLMQTVKAVFTMDSAFEATAVLTPKDDAGAYRLYLTIPCTHTHAVYTVAGSGETDTVRNVEDTYEVDRYVWGNAEIRSGEG